MTNSVQRRDSRNAKTQKAKVRKGKQQERLQEETQIVQQLREDREEIGPRMRTTLCGSKFQESAVPVQSKVKIEKSGADQNAAVRLTENFLCCLAIFDILEDKIQQYQSQRQRSDHRAGA